MKYVTYDPQGKLTGAYIQDLQPDHDGIHIEATDDQLKSWVMYQANATFSELELAPVLIPIQKVPQSVTMRQARLALHAAGLLTAVDAAIAAMAEPEKTATQITWEYAQTVDRGFGMVPTLAAALGMTETQIDDLFIAAAQL